MLGSADTARRGNRLSSFGMLLAVMATLLYLGLDWWMVVGGIAVGTIIGVVASMRVQMTGMPEMVALFNGFGGLASLLVGGAVALGSWVMTAAQETTGVYVTSNAVAPGDRVSAQQLSVVQVRGEHIHEHYLIADETLPAEAVALRVLAAGEFIPRSAIGDAQLMLDRPIAIPMSTSLSKNVTAGSLADLWFVPDVSATVSNGASPDEAPTSEPRQLAAGLVVAEITENSGLMARSGLSVHVLVPTDLLPAVLGALAAPGTVSLVPVPGALS